MNRQVFRVLFPILITITLFSIWAGFALLVVNKFFYKDLPGYKIGRLCIWELVAIVIAGLITKVLINKWGNVDLRMFANRKYLTMNPKFGIYFGIYFLILIFVGIWQFWIFSQKF